jgi:uncharacterized protein (DUF4415 family)
MKSRQHQIEYIRNLKDEDIDYSDAPEVTDFTNWQPNPFFKPIKVQLSAKVDKDIFAWLKLHGEVSKFINKVLREKMLAERTQMLST